MPETSQTTTQPIAVQRDPSRLEHGFGNLSALAQLKRMQRVLFEMTQTEGIDRREAAQCACAWERLQARKAAMTMRPAPKPIDVADLERAKERRKAAKANSQEASWRKRPKVVALPVQTPHIVPVDPAQ